MRCRRLQNATFCDSKGYSFTMIILSWRVLVRVVYLTNNRFVLGYDGISETSPTSQTLTREESHCYKSSSILVQDRGGGGGGGLVFIMMYGLVTSTLWGFYYNRGNSSPFRHWRIILVEYYAHQGDNIYLVAIFYHCWCTIDIYKSREAQGL